MSLNQLNKQFVVQGEVFSRFVDNGRILCPWERSLQAVTNGSHAQIDYKIARDVYDLLDAAHINDEELSFLLGKPNPYFFDLINPTGKDKFKTAQLDVQPTILNTTIR